MSVLVSLCFTENFIDTLSCLFVFASKLVLIDEFTLKICFFVGGTTVSINYLRRWGYIKPVPSKEKLKEIYADKKEQIIEKGQTLKGNVMQSLKPTERKKKNP